MDKPPADGGLAIHVANLCEQLMKHGHTCPVLRLVDHHAGDNNKSETWRDEYRLPCSYGLIQGYRLLPALRNVLNEIKPDIVHVHGCFTTLSPTLLSQIKKQTPVIGTLHDIRPFCYVMSRRFAPNDRICNRRCGIGCFTSGCIKPQQAVDILRLSRRWLMDGRTLGEWQTFDRVIAPSDYIKQLAIQHGIPCASLRLVPHGTELPALAPRCSNQHDTPVIMYLGSLLEYKGVLHLVKALCLLKQPEWRAVFVGNGPLRDVIMQQLNASGLTDRVEILDAITQRDVIQQLLAHARMLVLPSTIPESFALVGIEALAAATPVVSFALGGINQWFRDGENGLAATDMNCIDLARQIDRLLASPQLADQMGANGRTLIENSFTSASAFAGTLNVYHELFA